jgi:phage shock protein E
MMFEIRFQKAKPVSNATKFSSVSRLVGFVAMVIASLFLVTACSSTTSAVQTVDPAVFLSTASQPGVVLVDVRTPGEFASGHLQGAVNIDVEGVNFDQNIAALDKSIHYAVYCRSGRRSALASDKMAGAGFTNITNSQLGIADLQAAGGTVITG